jgi:ABC-2 type transport system permease protein
MARALVLRHMLRQRRRSTLWWTIGVAVAAVVFAAAYPSVEQSSADLEEYMESLPEGLTELLGAGAGIATPVGYLNSQLYANVFPLLLVVMGVGAAAWAIAGSEIDGTLEMLLASPVRRARVAWERLAGVVVVTGVVVVVTTLALWLVAPAFSLSDGLSAAGLWAASLGSWVLALLFAALSFAVGAATGRRGLAVAAGSAAAAGTYVLYGISSFVDALSPLRWASPWFWYLDADPLAAGFSGTVLLQAVLLPLAVAGVGVSLGVARFVRRDLGAA